MQNIDGKRPTPILIYGPTASGKSAAAIKLAQTLDGVIINADALQVYKSYEILTARPSPEDLARAQHALYGYVNDDQLDYSVGQWLRDVEQFLGQSAQQPIFVGGTGLYFRALINGLADIPPTPSETRDKIQNLFNINGLQYIIDMLSRVDEAILSRIDVQNPRRVMRALEVYEATQKPLSQWQNETPPPLIGSSVRFVLSPDVSQLRSRIEHRAEAMWSLGVVDEVRAKMTPWQPELPVNKAIGSPEIAAYLLGEIDAQSAKSALVTATQRYAKRQRSWARSNMRDWQWFDSADTLVEHTLAKPE